MVLVCDKVDTEPVLLLPPQLTKSTYATLLALDFVPRKWHVEGRYGSRTHKVEEKNEGKPSRNKIGIPLLPSLKNIRFIESILKTRDDGCDEETNSNYDDTYGLASSKDLRDLHASLLTPGVQLVHKPPVASNKIPKVEIFDATVHPELMPPNFPSQLRNFLQSVGIQSDENGHHEKPQKRQKYTNLTPKDYAHSKKITTCSSSSPAFTFCELFAGIGGFGVALEALGGSCVFASEIYEPSKRVYRNNLDLTNLPNQEIAGDIWDIDSKDIPYHDLLVGGFPCQPFSSLGDQPGLKDPKIVSGRKHGIDKQSSSCFTNDDVFTEDGSEREHHAECNGRGQLFTQIVRVLRDLQPKGFLLENVPGLLTTDNGFALRTILSSLESVGYHVSYEVCSSRGLTAQSRKRLYIVGIKKNISYADDKEEGRALESSSPFQFPFMPDLHFRAGDVLHRAEELEQPNDDTGIPADLFRRLDSQVKASEQSGITDRSLSSSHLNLGSLLQLTHQQMDQLRHRSKSWKPAKLAWDDTTCDTIDSHYGVSVGKGNSQLVPSRAPDNPRKFTPRECARIMGFSNSFILGNYTYNESQPIVVTKVEEVESFFVSSFNRFIKEQYYMLGNAVSPPVIAILAGSILECIIPASSMTRTSNTCGHGTKTGTTAVDYLSHAVDTSWSERGLWTGIKLAYCALLPAEHGAAMFLKSNP